MYTWYANPPAGIDTYGLVVGTNATAPAISQYALVAKIPNGTGAGTYLSYGLTSVGTTGTTGSSRIFAMTRDFTNQSLADITVRETGIYCYAGIGPNYYYCIERSTPAAQVIAVGETWTLTYTLGATVA
jgi:hypothetical protein